MLQQRINAPCVFKNNLPRSIDRKLSCHVFAQQQNHPYKITQGASPSQKLPILKRLLAEKLNPLSLDMDRFTVATTTAASSTEEEEKLIGFGQLKPLDANSLELSSLVVDPEYR